MIKSFDLYIKEENEAKQKAERYGFFYIVGECLTVFDGGKRARYDKKFVYDCSSGSTRDVSEEEIKLWNHIV